MRHNERTTTGALPSTLEGSATENMKNAAAIASLKEQVTTIDATLTKLKEVADFKGRGQEPNEPVLRDLWLTVYTALMTQMFEKGLSYYNNKPTQLYQNLQLCVIRADEAVEQYIKVRNTCPDPVAMAQARWAKEVLSGAKP